MKQTKLIFSKSLNPIPSTIRYYDLIDKLKRYNRHQRYKNVPEIDLETYCERHDINFTDEIRQPIDRLKYYKRFSKRTYNR